MLQHQLGHPQLARGQKCLFTFINYESTTHMFWAMHMGTCRLTSVPDVGALTPASADVVAADAAVAGPYESVAQQASSYVKN